MKLINRETDYAVRALARMAAAPDGGHSAASLGPPTGVSGPFLRKILQKLNRAGILRSRRGRGGGFELARPPERITLTDVLEVFQGPIKTDNCVLGRRVCPNLRTCVMKGRISAIERKLAAELGDITISRLAGRAS